MIAGPMPDFSYEDAARLNGHRIIAGVDEVGRGPMAGPVTAAAVILDPNAVPQGLDDSKALSEQRRNDLAAQIHATAVVSIAHASVEEIDRINILAASHLAMERAVGGLPQTPDHLLIDGNRIPAGLQGRATSVVKGDSKSLSIAAASIVAKVCRDALMVELSQQFPGYGWEANAGYVTRLHKEALLEFGVTPHHRRSFAPVRNILCRD